ncbi:MAG: AAA family ATPase [Deltaproteobacteria bacterium]|nr:MAG: AAA family ATPase [Deltaproteobacteria bacterium]
MMIDKKIKKIIDEIEKIILGKREKIVLALTCLLANGHLLIEDLPGIGKTSLAKTLSLVMGLSFNRIQCTSDMLPGDVLGVSVFNQKTSEFIFHKGPVFTKVLLADEINRVTPKTQSALLEAMEEKQITIEGNTYSLEKPFFVIATQNPQDQSGTFPLPESQLDRFLFKIDIGYPDRNAEKIILQNKYSSSHSIKEALTVLDSNSVLKLQNQVRNVVVKDPLIDYLQNIIDYTRTSAYFKAGLSPRAGISILQASRAWAKIHSRDYVIPDDVKNVLPWAASHRLFLKKENRMIRKKEIKEMLNDIKIP